MHFNSYFENFGDKNHKILLLIIVNIVQCIYLFGYIVYTRYGLCPDSNVLQFYS